MSRPVLGHGAGGLSDHTGPDGVEQPDLSLGTLLRKAASTTDPERRWWSPSALERIITRQRLIDQLSAHVATRYDAEARADRIIHDSLKVFAALTLKDKQDQIYKLIDGGVTDKILPLELGEDSSKILSNGRPLSCFDDWSKDDRETFITRLKQVNPVILGSKSHKNIKHEVFQRSQILPILEETFHSLQGGYGQVTQVKLDPECHNFHGVLPSIDTTKYFALKKLFIKEETEETLSRKTEEFQKEVAALKRYSGFVHEHLVTLLMTWSIEGSMEDRHCLLFPWADRDLQTYWFQESNRYPCSGQKVDLEAIRWFAKQIKGMAGALAQIHDPNDKQYQDVKKNYGRHGDIKPENILWYQSPAEPKHGILVIADLGLTAMHSTYSRSKVPNRNIPATPDYKPPESELEGGVYSRAFDIWSFGCVLLEMVCWTLGGEHNRVGFETARQKPWILGVNRCIFFDVMLKTPETSILPKPSRKGLGAVLSPSSMCSVLPRVYSRMTFMRHAPGTPHSEPSIPSEPSHYEHAIMVKAKVNQWIVRLHADPMCTQFIHELLDLIENKMIIVITPGHERIRSGDLLVKLSEMCDKVSDPESSYGSKPCPKKQPLKECLPVDALLISRTKDLVKDNSLQVDTYQGKTQTSKTPDEFRAME